MTLRALLRGSLLYTLGNFLPRVGAFLLLPLYTASMAPAEFGIFSLMVSLAGLLAILYRLGLDGALLRIHFDIAPARRPSLYLTLAAVTLGAVLLFSAVLGLLSAPIFDRAFPGVSFVPYGLLALGITATMAFQYVPASLFRATERPERFVAFALGVFAVVVVSAILFLLVLDLGAVGGLLAQLTGGVAVLAVTILILLRLRRGRMDRELASRSLRFGLPLVPHGLAGWVLSLSDRWLIGLFIGLPAVAAQAAVGVYAFGYVLGQSVSLVATSFNAAWVPFWYSRGDGPSGPGILREVSSLTLGALSLLAVCVGVLAPELTELLAVSRWGNEALAAVDVIPVVAVASLAHGLYFMVVSTIFLRRRTAGLPLLTLLAGLANVGVNALLIPRLGIMGAAWATLVGYCVLAAATWWYAARAYPIRLDVGRLAAIGLLAVVAIVASRTVVPQDAGVWLSGAVHLAVAGAAAAVLFLLLRGPLHRLRSLVATRPTGTMDVPEEHA
jgi:O-antigen/teichoic acid export membrane protein